MENPGSVYIVPPLLLSQQQQQQLPPDRAVGALTAGGSSCEYDPVMENVCSPLLGVETEENNLLLAEVGKFIADIYPDLPLSPVKPQAHLQPPEAWNSAVPYPEWRGKGQYQEELEGSSAIRVGERAEEVPSGVDKGDVGASSCAKTGSQAFDYIDASAVLETDGIPACHQLGLPELDCAYTPSLCGDVPLGCMLPVLPHASVSSALDPCKPCDTGTTDADLLTALDKTSSDTLYPPSSYGNVNMDPKFTTVPDKTACGTLYSSNPCGTVNIDPKSATVPEGTSRVPDTNTANTGVSGNAKRRQRRKKKKAKGEEGEEKKKRKYEEEPLQDAKEERKRRDAIRAKRCRDKNRKEVEMLREELKERERELEGRRAWEKTLLSQLRATHGICVPPYGSQMMPLEPLSST